LLHDLTARHLSDAYRTKKLSPVEVTRAVLARIDTWDRKLNAMYVIDAEGALVQAVRDALARGQPIESARRRADHHQGQHRHQGRPDPVGTAAGDLTPAAVDQPPAARVGEGGCVMLGKTTMPDFGMFGFRRVQSARITCNPWNCQRTLADRARAPARRSQRAMVR
jgi:Asp-tRNA(Asn)/Glu-tRNA(Gln) amidotransferase A subunit family amidase